MNLLALLLTIAFATSTASGQSSRPNILFAVADDASWEHFSAYGCDWVDTPVFDRVARDGILFTRAYTPNAKCSPSRSCIVTGRNSWQLGEAANHMNRISTKYLSYVEILDAQGYHTGHTGKGWGPGLAKDENGNDRHLAGKPFNQHELEPPAKHISETDYAKNFEAFLDAKPAGTPFCFWYGGKEPHRRYEAGVGRRLGGKSLSEIDEVPAFWPDTETVRSDMLDYGYEIEYFDKHLGHMLETLENRGLLENTLVVVTSDNGMPFPRVKGQLYEYSHHMPLAMMWPAGITKPGRTIDDYISFIDFAPTFLEIANVDPITAGMAPIQGRSLTNLLQSTQSGRVDPDRDFVLIGKERHDPGRPNNLGYPIRGILRDGYLYLVNYETDRWPSGNPEAGYLNCDGSPTKTQILQMRRDGTNTEYWQLNFGKRVSQELYNVEKDPACVVNLASNPEYAPRLSELRDAMESALREQDDPRMFGNGKVFEEYEIAWDFFDQFYERIVAGKNVPTRWVNPTDFEDKPLD